MKLCLTAPYYVAVFSAGNDGNNNAANGDPLNGNSFFNKLNGNKTSKNSIVVANAQDANIDANGNLVSVLINSGSSEGPTDDYRIKPDITGNGTGLFSTFETADDVYNTISGTSMAAPNVTGSLLLLQQYYQELNGTFMKASTLKGLALHTADDVAGSAGLEGPDAVYGWGLMNTKRAAETIRDQGIESMIQELTINQGETLTYTVTSDGINPLLTSISWTDRPGEVASGTANDPTPALVNDLDIRISNNSDTFLPWRLTGVESNEKGDNLVDPYERIDVTNPSGEYTITITHKGTLEGGSQNFSLIVTGVTSDFTITPTASLVRDVCSNESPTFEFMYRQTNTTTTSLSLENLPVGVTGTFSSNSLTSSGTFDVTLENLGSLANGSYSFDVVANNGTKTEKRSGQITITNPTTTGFETTLNLPINTAKGLDLETLNLEWQEVTSASSYRVEVSKSPSFNQLAFSGEVTSTNFSLSSLESNTIYYWRVKPINICQEGGSEIFSFQTEVESCSNTFDATITSNSIGGLGVRNVQVDIDQSIIASRLKVNMDISHTSVGDLTIELREPTANGTARYDLISSRCGDVDDLSNIIFDDLGSDVVCNATSPALTGPIKPEESLTAIKGQDVQGSWRISITDLVNSNESGVLNSASITVCSASENTQVPSLSNSGINVVANGAYTFSASDLEATFSSDSPSNLTYTLVVSPSLGSIQKNSIGITVGDTFTQEDINNGLISFTNTQTSLFSDSFKVDVTNSTKGWLPNQTVNLTATSLSDETFEINGLDVYPNPSFGDLNVTLNPRTENNIQIRLFDLQGRTVFDQTFENNSSNFNKVLPVTNLSNGVYILSISEGNYSSTRRVILSK